MSAAMRALRCLRTCRSGSTAIEFSIVSLVLVLVVLGTIEFGRSLNIRNNLSQAADFAARRILTDSSISNSAIEDEVRSAFTAGAAGMLAVTVGAETVDGVQFRTIAMSYPFTPLISGLADGVITLSLARRTPII